VDCGALWRSLCGQHHQRERHASATHRQVLLHSPEKSGGAREELSSQGKGGREHDAENNWGYREIEFSKKKSERAFTFDPEQGEQLLKNVSRQGARFMVAPIFDWTDEDVWAYIRDRNLPYCSLYDEGFKRLGCIGCPMASKGREQQFCVGLNSRRLISGHSTRCFGPSSRQSPSLPGKTGHDVFDWWMSDGCRRW